MSSIADRSPQHEHGDEEHEPSRRRSWWRRLRASRHEDDVEDAQRTSEGLGGQRCNKVKPRQRAVMAGSLRSVTLRPDISVPAVEAELYDGSGSVVLIWMGRRVLRGVHAGQQIRVQGLVCERDDELVMYNPRYELLGGGKA